MDVRLLAPRAELRLQVGGGSSMIDASRLSYLGEALRALLVIEVSCGSIRVASPLHLLITAAIAMYQHIEQTSA